VVVVLVTPLQPVERRRRNHRPLIGYLILAVSVVAAFWAFHLIIVHIDERNGRQDAALRAVLCLARNNTLTSKQRTPAEKQAIVLFYDQALRLLHVAPCTFPRP
jgi:hypothetical protein